MNPRIIPALAGNTDIKIVLIQAAGDHPRSRGEYTPPGPAVTGEVGSSPLSRGILAPRCAAAWPLRIIPALAGNTSAVGWSAASTKDHPRSRGEYYPAPPGRKPCTGSSPLSRGIPFRGVGG